MEQHATGLNSIIAYRAVFWVPLCHVNWITPKENSITNVYITLVMLDQEERAVGIGMEYCKSDEDVTKFTVIPV